MSKKVTFHQIPIELLTIEDIPTHCVATDCGFELTEEQRMSYFYRKKRGIKIKGGPFCRGKCRTDDYKIQARLDAKKLPTRVRTR